MTKTLEWKYTIEEVISKERTNKEAIGVIEFYIQNGEVWLNSIEVIDDFKRKNIATRLIKEGIQEFGMLLISTATKAEHKMQGDPDDSRYLEPDGCMLVKALLSSGVIKNEWLRNPFKSTGNTI